MSTEDRVREPLAYLIRASALLGSSLDYEQTLSQLAHLLVPYLADWCSVDLMDDPDTIRNVAVAHVDPSKVELAKELQRRYPPDPHAATGMPHVVQTGQSELYPQIPESIIVEAAVDQDHLRLIRRLGSLHSAIIAPLSARGRRLGAITLVSAESGRVYKQDDVVLAEQLGERAGLAIDNGRYALPGSSGSPPLTPVPRWMTKRCRSFISPAPRSPNPGSILKTKPRPIHSGPDRGPVTGADLSCNH